MLSNRQGAVLHVVLLVGLMTTLSAMKLPTVVVRPPRVFAGPQIMIFSGGSLRKRVVIDDIRENMLILAPPQYRGSSLNTLKGSLNHRPFVRLSLFWGPQWRPLVGSDSALRLLSEAKANQRGRYYPARARDAAIVVLDGTYDSASAVRLDSAALEILTRHGIPLRLR